jgi:hypothetical protein
MKCFYHENSEAVGLCKYCSRGICRDCAAERPGGVACKGSHEEKVDLISSLIERNVRLSTRGSSVSLIAVIVYWGAALICGYLILTQANQTGKLLFGVMAAVMLVAAIANTRLLLSRLYAPVKDTNPRI